MLVSARLSYALTAALILAAPVSAQQAGITALPDSTVARIDGIFAALGGPQAPGCAVGVSRQEQPVLTRAYGLANLEYDVPNTPETIFESGSVAKQFTAAAVQLLAQDGKLSLDDDIRRYLPEVPDFGKTIRIRHLLTHTSGLRDQWGLLGLRGSAPGTQVHSFDTILDLVSHQRALNFDPGSEYLYSNTGYVLAAVIVSRVSGKPFAEFTQERLFRPLGMVHTRWRDDFRAIVKGRATAYDGTVQRGFTQDMPFTNVHGNGGLLTTVGDLLRWNAFLDAPPAQFGGDEFARTMQTPATLTSGRRITYALGLDVQTRDGIREVTHGGATAGYRTWLARYPDQKVSIAVLCNVSSANPTRLGTQVANLLVPRPAAPAAAPAVALSAAELARYAGLFYAPSSGSVIRVAVKNGQLVSDEPSAATLVALEPGRFRMPAGVAVYEMAGSTVRDLLVINGTDTTRYRPVTSVAPRGAQLAQYAGSYWSDELDTRLVVEARDSVLVIKRRPADVMTLRPAFADTFVGENFDTIAFTRDKSGRVNGFGVYAGRVRNVRFAREPVNR